MGMSEFKRRKFDNDGVSHFFVLIRTPIILTVFKFLTYRRKIGLSLKSKQKIVQTKKCILQDRHLLCGDSKLLLTKNINRHQTWSREVFILQKK